MQVIEEIQRLKKERDAIILAHYYVDGTVQAVADYVGDSYYLSQMANQAESKTVVLCGVRFMGESAKIMNPGKTVLMPDLEADCPMAHMADLEKIDRMRAEYDDLAVVCYINSTAQTKARSDVCVTSSNALTVIGKLSNKRIYFIPDEHLARYIAAQLPEKQFIFHDGYCHVHAAISGADVDRMKAQHPGVPVLAHPECKAEVLERADFVGSTTGIIDYAAENQAKEFIICTETGVLYELSQQNPDKKFYVASQGQVCPDMKRITVEKLVDCLKTMQPEIVVEESLRIHAMQSLEAMHTLAGG